MMSAVPYLAGTLTDSDTFGPSSLPDNRGIPGFSGMVHSHDVSESVKGAMEGPARDQSAVSMSSERVPLTGASRPAACAFLAAEIISLMRLSWFASLAPGS